MRRATPPGLSWLVGVLAATVLAGGIAQVLAERTDPVITTTVVEREVLPEDQAEVTGHVDAFVADDAVGAPISMPIDLESGGAEIEGALVDGKRSTIAWDGGRPFRLSGDGAVDLGPARVELVMGALLWSLDGLRILSPGTYALETPVAVGAGGLASPRDRVDFVADEETSITTRGGAAVARDLPVHLEGPGSFTAEGRFTIRTRAGTIDATHLEFGPGAFVVDVAPDGSFTATFNGDLTIGA